MEHIDAASLVGAEHEHVVNPLLMISSCFTPANGALRDSSFNGNNALLTRTLFSSNNFDRKSNLIPRRAMVSGVFSCQ
jgi:hypothetical protein